MRTHEAFFLTQQDPKWCHCFREFLISLLANNDNFMIFSHQVSTQQPNLVTT